MTRRRRRGTTYSQPQQPKSKLKHQLIALQVTVFLSLVYALMVPSRVIVGGHWVKCSRTAFGVKLAHAVADRFSAHTFHSGTLQHVVLGLAARVIVSEARGVTDAKPISSARCPITTSIVTLGSKALLTIFCIKAKLTTWAIRLVRNGILLIGVTHAIIRKWTTYTVDTCFDGIIRAINVSAARLRTTDLHYICLAGFVRSALHLGPSDHSTNHTCGWIAR